MTTPQPRRTATVQVRLTYAPYLMPDPLWAVKKAIDTLNPEVNAKVSMPTEPIEFDAEDLHPEVAHHLMAPHDVHEHLRVWHNSELSSAVLTDNRVLDWAIHYLDEHGIDHTGYSITDRIAVAHHEADHREAVRRSIFEKSS